MEERVVAVVQARMTSERLPGKVLLPIGDLPLLAWVLRAARSAKRVEMVVLATTVNPSDDCLLGLAADYGAVVYRGSETDVLDRFHRAILAHPATHVVRLSADCPFLDPKLIDDTIKLCVRSDADYATNGLDQAYPLGLDVEVFRASALEAAWQEAKELYHRSHVTSFLYKHPERFRIAFLRAPAAFDERWTVDTAEDLAFARAVASRLPRDRSPAWTEVWQVLIEQPELRRLNAGVTQRPLEVG